MQLLSDNLVTPNEIFFIRNHLPVPDIDENIYELEITGEGINTVTLSLEVIYLLVGNFKRCLSCECACMTLIDTGRSTGKFFTIEIVRLSTTHCPESSTLACVGGTCVCKSWRVVCFHLASCCSFAPLKWVPAMQMTTALTVTSLCLQCLNQRPLVNY